MNELKAALTIPWANSSGYYQREIRGTDSAFFRVPLIFRAIRFRCNALSKVPLYVYDANDNELEDGYIFEDMLPLTGGEESLIWRSEASILLKGFSPVLKLKNRYRYGKGLQWLNPFSIKITLTDGEYHIWQEVANGQRFPSKGYWTLDDFVWLKSFNPIDDLGPGTAAADVAMRNSQASYSTDDFLSNFFTADAIPVTIITSKTGGKGEVKRLEELLADKFNKMKRAAARILGIQGEDVKIERLTANLKDFAFDNIDNHIEKQIAYAFDIPKSVLAADETGYSNGQRLSYKSFISDTIVPRCMFYEYHLNKYLQEYADGQYIKFAPEELPEMQEDEVQRADALTKYVNAGFDLMSAIDTLGIELSEETKTKLEAAQKLKEERAANPPQPPVQQQPTQIQAQQPPTQSAEGKGYQEGDATKLALDKWFRKAISNYKSGRAPTVEFESNYIPNEMKSDILIGLKNAKTEEEIRELFAHANNGGNHA